MKLTNNTTYHTRLLKQIVAAVWRREQKSRTRLVDLQTVVVETSVVGVTYRSQGSKNHGVTLGEAPPQRAKDRYSRVSGASLYLPVGVRARSVAALVRSLAWYCDGVTHKTQPDNVRRFQLPDGYCTGHAAVDLLLTLDVELAVTP